MGRTIFAYAESIVCPNELNRNLHKGCHTDGGLHIIREDKECAASGDNTSMQVHTNAYASHGELAYACLEEGTTEIVGGDVVCLLKEAVGLI